MCVCIEGASETHSLKVNTMALNSGRLHFQFKMKLRMFLQLIFVKYLATPTENRQGMFKYMIAG